MLFQSAASLQKAFANSSTRWFFDMGTQAHTNQLPVTCLKQDRHGLCIPATFTQFAAVLQ